MYTSLVSITSYSLGNTEDCYVLNIRQFIKASVYFQPQENIDVLVTMSNMR